MIWYIFLRIVQISTLIERLCKFVKGKLRSKYYDDFKEFSSTIDTIIKDTEGRYKQQIESLIGEKIQLFDNFISLTENTFIRQEASIRPLHRLGIQFR